MNGPKTRLFFYENNQETFHIYLKDAHWYRVSSSKQLKKVIMFKIDCRALKLNGPHRICKINKKNKVGGIFPFCLAPAGFPTLRAYTCNAQIQRGYPVPNIP